LLPSAEIKHIKLAQLTGNLWQGSAIASYHNKLNTKINWAINLSHIFSEQSVTTITLSTAKSELLLSSNFNGLSPEFKVQGKLDSQEISSQIALPKRVKMTGIVDIQNLNLINVAPYYMDKVNIDWAGGAVTDDNNHTQLPALSFRSIQENGQLIINMTETAHQQLLLKIKTTANKQAEIQITQRLLTLTKQGKLSDDENEFVIRFTENLTF
jgi:hypothetical protein